MQWQRGHTLRANLAHFCFN